MARPAYEVAQLAYALDRFEKILPNREVWRTAYAAQLIDQSLAAAGIVTSTAIILMKGSGPVASAISGAVEGINQAERDLVPFAQKVGQALGRGDVDVYLPDFRIAVLRLLRALVVAWKELAYLEDAKPLFLRLNLDAIMLNRKLAETIEAIHKTGLVLLNLPAPTFPVPVPKAPPSASTSRRIFWAAFAGVVATTGVLIWRRRRF
jgi:hypothetical protein